MRIRHLLFAFPGLLLTVPDGRGADVNSPTVKAISVVPADVRLADSRSHQQLLVTAQADGYPLDVTRDVAEQRVQAWRTAGQVIVFSNGVYDIIHAGHVRYLTKAIQWRF